MENLKHAEENGIKVGSLVEWNTGHGPDHGTVQMVCDNFGDLMIKDWRGVYRNIPMDKIRYVSSSIRK